LCRYAKFEYSLTARPCCAVDPIEKEEDRNKALATINSLLEKADEVLASLLVFFGVGGGNNPVAIVDSLFLFTSVRVALKSVSNI
jgi:hypothetical protein